MNEWEKNRSHFFKVCTFFYLEFGQISFLVCNVSPFFFFTFVLYFIWSLSGVEVSSFVMFHRFKGEGRAAILSTKAAYKTGTYTTHFHYIFQSFSSHFPVIFQSFSSHFPAIFQLFSSHFPVIFQSFSSQISSSS